MLKAYFDPYIDTGMQDWQPLLPMIRMRQYPNRTTIKNAGDIERHLRFIINGAGVILIKEGDKEICTDICLEKEFLTDFESLTTGKKTNTIIKNFGPIDVAEVHKKDFMPYYEHSLLAAHLGKILADRQHIRSRHHHLENYRGLSARERYERLVSRHAKMFLRIPQYHIASYLGMSEQTMSRLRKADGQQKRA